MREQFFKLYCSAAPEKRAEFLAEFERREVKCTADF